MSVEWAFKLIVSGGYITEEMVKEKEEGKETESGEWYYENKNSNSYGS